MSLLAIIFLSVALAVDVFGLSFAYGLIIKQNRIKLMLRLAVTCGLFQFAMPIIGFSGTSLISSFVNNYSNYANYIVCFVFVCLGLNVLKEAFKNDGEAELKEPSLSWKTTIMIDIATSIDALVSGTMLYLTQTPILSSALIIGVGSFIIGIIGFNLNCCLKKIPEKYLQFLAGLILIGLGIKNLF